MNVHFPEQRIAWNTAVVLTCALCVFAGMHTSVHEIHLSNSDSSYFLRVDWEGQSLGSGFRLLLTDGQDAWRGEGTSRADMLCAFYQKGAL